MGKSGILLLSKDITATIKVYYIFNFKLPDDLPRSNLGEIISI